MSWLSNSFDRILAAASALKTGSTARPSGVDRTVEIGTEIVPIPKDHNPEAVLRYRREARRGDPRNLFAVYTEMPGRAAGPQIRRSREAIEAAEWEFAPMPLAARDETVNSPEARVGREVAAYFTEVYGPHMVDALRVYARREHFGLGAAAFQVEPLTGPEGLERIVSFEEIESYRFRLDPRTFAWHYYPKAHGSNLTACAPLVEQGSLLLFEEGAKAFPIDQRGLLWQVLIPWAVYQYGFRWWARLNERFALPYLDVDYDPTLEKGAEKAEEIAQRMGSSGAIVRPKESIEAKFLSTMSAAQPDSLERMQEFCLRAFAAGLLGHDQATGAREGAGARTSDVAAQGVAKWLVASQLRRAGMDFGNQWIKPAVLRNFGEKVAAKHTPVLVLRQAQEVDRESEARIVNLATAAGAELPESEFLKKIGYRQARPGERTLSRRQLAPPAPPAAEEGKPAEKLGENIVRFPRLAENGRPPVLGADGAPDGIAEDLLSPYRRIFTEALSDGATPVQAISRVMQRAKTRPEAKVLVDRLASVLVASTGNGLEDVRDERSGK